MRKLLSLIVAVVLCASSFAQLGGAPPPIRKPSVPSGTNPDDVGRRIAANTVTITNSSRTALTITLIAGPDQDTVRIPETRRWISRRYVTDPTITIKTDTIPVRYLLMRGKEYLLYWNDRNKIWDVSLIDDK
jgi:hypothetical protein